MGIVNPQQSNPGDTIEASDVNTPVNQIAAVLNGNVDSSNLAPNAVVVTAITDTAVTPAKLQTGTGSSWTPADYSGTATIVGWSSTTTKQITYIQMGKEVHMYLYITGTSNSTSTTVSLPVTPSTSVKFFDASYGLAQDNGSFKSATCRYSIDNSAGAATTVVFYPDVAGGSWTASSTKSIRAMVTYVAA